MHIMQIIAQDDLRVGDMIGFDIPSLPDIRQMARVADTQR